MKQPKKVYKYKSNYRLTKISKQSWLCNIYSSNIDDLPIFQNIYGDFIAPFWDIDDLYLFNFLDRVVT